MRWRDFSEYATVRSMLATMHLRVKAYTISTAMAYTGYACVSPYEIDIIIISQSNTQTSKLPPVYRQPNSRNLQHVGDIYL